MGWIYWIDFFAYSYKALFMNEMKGLVFKCDQDSHIPIGPTYNNSLYRVCSLPGAEPGATEVRAEVYLKQTYDFDTDQLAISIIAILLFWILFTVVNAIAVEKLEWTHGGFMKRLYKRGKAPKQNDDATEMELAKKAELATQNMQPIELVCYLRSEFCTITHTAIRKQEFLCGMSCAILCQSKSNQMALLIVCCWIMLQVG